MHLACVNQPPYFRGQFLTHPLSSAASPPPYASLYLQSGVDLSVCSVEFRCLRKKMFSCRIFWEVLNTVSTPCRFTMYINQKRTWQKLRQTGELLCLGLLPTHCVVRASLYSSRGLGWLISIQNILSATLTTASRHSFQLWESGADLSGCPPRSIFSFLLFNSYFAQLSISCHASHMPKGTLSSFQLH